MGDHPKSKPFFYGSCSEDHNNTYTNPICDSNFNNGRIPAPNQVGSFQDVPLNQTTLMTQLQYERNFNQPSADFGVMSATCQGSESEIPSPTCAANLQSRKRANTPDPIARKRRNDKAYRERCKIEKLDMKSNMETLSHENERLRGENDSLKKDNVLVNEQVQSQAKEIEQLKNDFNKLNYDCRKQAVLVETLSELQVNCPDFRKENEQLKHENFVLKEITGENEKLSQLICEIGKLGLENRLLKVKNDALCENLVIYEIRQEP